MDKKRDLLVNMEDLDFLWQAVQERDARFVGEFFVAVRTTGIYCIPSCPSRLPHRENVSFFRTYAEAEKAGFRACKRCQPREALSQNQQVEITRKMCRLMDANVENPPSLENLGHSLNMSPSYLHKVFKTVMGITPHAYTAEKRLSQFKSRVKEGFDLTSALYDAGYSSTSRLYEGISQRMGMTPAAYRRGGAGKKIWYALTSTYLGLMLVAVTEKGICAVSFGQDEEMLQSALFSEFPLAELQKDEAYLSSTIKALIRHLEGELPYLELPLDLQATAFQLRVWEELRKIPYGETRTYAEVAEAVGKPKAVRAVANACAANPVVVVTPCHRVVRSDGSLGGYRYGVERKRALLNKEQNH
jgi:AraC family transcriptional regulator, regulatory protein of adaptative response / methylated-DNA-[protein]-cysteine methyltransferase